MKKFFRLLIFFYSLFGAIELRSQTEKIIETPFYGEEWFEFRIYYGFFNASYASIKLKNDTINNIPVFHSMGYGKTTGLARWFFKVDDYYESYFDREKIIPYKFIRNIYEGGYTKNIEINFDQEKLIANINDKKNNTITKLPFNYNAQDLVSSFYYLRKYFPRNEFKLNESFVINMFFDNDNYIFKLKYLGKEIIDSKFGKIECLKFIPMVQSGRIFKEQESVTIWISNDKNRIPIRVQADVIVGSIKADLENFKNLKYPFKINF